MSQSATENLNFCDALRAIKAGKRAQRAGWNGKGLFAFLQPGSVHGPYIGHKFQLAMESAPDEVETIDGVSVALFDTNGAEHTAMRYPQLCLSFPSGTFGAWAPSQTDMLASDWLVEEAAKEALPPLAKYARGYAIVDRRDTRTLSALKEFAVSIPSPVSRDDLSFMVVHPSLREIEEGERIPTYRAAWSDREDSLVFVAGSE
jgi:hypothetical protein